MKMITLRELKAKDAPYMLEWMHDSDIQKGFKKRMSESTIDDVLKFIKEAEISNTITTGMNLHYAIIDQKEDLYLGTVSLKNIDLENRNAEYAITTRKQAQGHGVAYKATMLILNKAFFEIGLQRVYLSVFSNNVNAIKLYEKCGFKFEGEFRNHFLIENKYVGWKWFGILKEEYGEKVVSI